MYINNGYFGVPVTVALFKNEKMPMPLDILQAIIPCVINAQKMAFFCIITLLAIMLMCLCLNLITYNVVMAGIKVHSKFSCVSESIRKQAY